MESQTTFEDDALERTDRPRLQRRGSTKDGRKAHNVLENSIKVA